MTRTDIENLTREQLLELVLDLDHRNKKAGQILWTGWGNGNIPFMEAVRTLGVDRPKENP